MTSQTSITLTRRPGATNLTARLILQQALAASVPIKVLCLDPDRAKAFRWTLYEARSKLAGAKELRLSLEGRTITISRPGEETLIVQTGGEEP